MFDAAQAVHSESKGPFVPSSIETQPAARFGNDLDDRERVDAVGPPLVEHLDAGLERLQAADSGGDRRADALWRSGNVDARVRLGLPRSRQREMGEAVHAARGLEVDVLA